MENIYNYLTKNLDDSINKNNVFLFSSSQIKAIAFKQGCNCDCISKIKGAIKKWGFKYDYDFDAYILKEKKDTNYRSQKNAFISSLIEWKIKKIKTSKNGKEPTKLYFEELH